MLKDLVGWKEENNVLAKTFEFKTYLKTISFVNAIAWEANRVNHHPELVVGYSKCEVRLCTHDAGYKVTDKDFKLAKIIDGLMA